MKRSTMTVTALAVAGLVAGLGTALVTEPADASAPTLELRPAAIERGADLPDPHVQGSTIHDGDLRITLKWPRVTLLGPSGSAYVVNVSGKNGLHPKTLRVLPNGHKTVLATGRDAWNVLLSGDGDDLLTTPSTSPDRTVVRVLDARTGDLVRKRTFPGSVTVLDADESRAVLGSWGPDRTIWWNYVSNTTQRINKRVGYAADITAGRLASFTGDPYDDGCSVVTDLRRHPHRLWRSCQERVEEFAPSGDRIATVHILSDGLGPTKVRARATDGGKLLATYTVGAWFGRLSWESDSSLLLDTYGKKKWATIRCDRATCDRATRLRRTPSP